MNFKRHVHFNSHMGRMGNQMFQYACAKALQWHHGYSTSLSDLDKVEFFELEKGERITNRIKSFLFFRLWKPLFGMKILNTGFECMYRSYLPDLLKIEEPTMVWGFFQSYKYFEVTRERIQKVFKVKPAYNKKFEEFLEKHNVAKGRYLAIHLRRTDYKGFTIRGLQTDDFTLPLSYYHESLRQVGWSGPVLFVSDEPELIKQLFPELHDVIVSREDAITDFLLIQHAHTCIISNSTFAWWAAWLNKNANEVYCPKYFLGFKENIEVPVAIYPKNWKQIDVNNSGEVNNE